MIALVRIDSHQVSLFLHQKNQYPLEHTHTHTHTNIYIYTYIYIYINLMVRAKF